ncbi:MAG TPA: NADP-dependent phosphogluconate dehydrogenase [Candidatus Eisenbacteria bacterium]|nr:NADP-dependent phosphogluconate dehydrogenase [Candidatus Eisenbacteria bacterium]
MLLGFLGLGKMGGRMVTKLLQDGHDIVVWNRSYDTTRGFVETHKKTKGKLFAVEDIIDFKNLSDTPHVFWSMVLFGQPTEDVLHELKNVVGKGDVVINGANSFYKDTQRHYEMFKKMGVHFLGIGVSGGILAPDNGFPLMVGGSGVGYKKVMPILDSLAKPHGGHEYFGEGGVGHYVKMIHNGIEYGMMQSIGEGFGVLDKGPYKMDLEKVASLWTKGTIIASFLMDRARDALQKDGKLEKTAGFIEENGEAKWTIALAKKLHVPIGVIEDSLTFRQDSQKSKRVENSFAAKMVAALRHEFGGHKVKEK